MKRDIHKFGGRGDADVEKKVIQLLTIDVIKPDKPKDLNKEDRCASLGYFLSLKKTMASSK